MKSAIRRVHIGIKDVAEPGYQNDIAVAFAKLMEKEMHLNEREAMLTMRERPVTATNRYRSNVRSFVGTSNLKITRTSSTFVPATIQKENSNVQVTGEDSSDKFAKALRNSSDRLPQSTLKPSVTGTTDTGKPKLNAVNPALSASITTQEATPIQTLKQCNDPRVYDNGVAEKEPGELDANESESDEVNEAQGSLLKLVGLASERKD